MDMQSILALTSAGLGFLFSVFLTAEAVRGRAPRSTVPLALAILLGAAVEALDWQIFQTPADLPVLKPVALVLEGAMAPAWLAFTIFFARIYEEKGVPVFQKIILALACLMPLAGLLLTRQTLFYAPDFATERLLFLERPVFYFYLALVLFAVVSLFNLEATIANAAHFRRWKIKFSVIGAVAVLASQILYYSQGFLNRAIDMTLIPARSLALILGVGLMWYSRVRRGSEEVQIVFSKRIAFKSVVLVVAGLYLIGLGVAGELARMFGESLGRVLLLVAGIVGGVAVLALSLSESLQRRVRLFLQRNFYQEKYDYRIQWMQFTERLAKAQSRESLYQAVLSAYCEVFGIEGAMLFLLEWTGDRFQPVSRLEMDPLDFAPDRDHPLAQELARGRHVLDLRKRGNDQILAPAGATFLVPLVLRETLDGFILLGPAINTSENYDDEDFELMGNMAQHVSAALLNLRLTEQLSRARDMEVMGRVSTFILHDLKNLVYTLSLVVENARKYIDNPDFQTDMLKSLGNTVAKMKVLITQLKGLPERQTLRREGVDLLQLARETAAMVPEVRVRFEGDGIPVRVDREEMQKVVLNLYMNAMEASGRDEEIVVEVGRQGQPYLRVTDKGCGMDEQFQRESLFEPFRTTKPKGMGIGLYQCQQIVTAHGGRIEVKSEPDKGSAFTVWLQDESGEGRAPERA